MLTMRQLSHRNCNRRALHPCLAINAKQLRLQWSRITINASPYTTLLTASTASSRYLPFAAGQEQTHNYHCSADVTTCLVITIPHPLVRSLWHGRKSRHISSVSRGESHPLGFLSLTSLSSYPVVFFLLQAASPLQTVSPRNWYSNERQRSDCNDSILSLSKTEQFNEFRKTSNKRCPWNFSVINRMCMKDNKVYLFSIQHLSDFFFLSSKYFICTSEWLIFAILLDWDTEVLSPYTGKPNYTYTYALQRYTLTLTKSL